MQKREITRADIMPMSEYAGQRRQRRQQVVDLKKRRRVEIGPFATLYFENYDTMLAQVHEMLFIEQGGEQQIADELSAYNPLVPRGNELVATLMLEIEDPVRRARSLKTLGGIEEAVTLSFGGRVVTGIPEDDVERTTADGKTSSVHFLHFRFDPEEIEMFRQPGQQVVAAIGHPNYGHMAIIPETVRAALAADFE